MRWAINLCTPFNANEVPFHARFLACSLDTSLTLTRGTHTGFHTAISGSNLRDKARYRGLGPDKPRVLLPLAMQSRL